jgi:hypothetical protein
VTLKSFRQDSVRKSAPKNVWFRLFSPS